MAVLGFCCLGMPSGHVMISMTVLLCCCNYLGGGGVPGKQNGGVADGAEGVAGEEGRGRVWRGRRVAQCLVLLFSTGIGLTRVLISSHFIHQVSLGVNTLDSTVGGCPY